MRMNQNNVKNLYVDIASYTWRVKWLKTNETYLQETAQPFIWTGNFCQWTCIFNVIWGLKENKCRFIYCNIDLSYLDIKSLMKAFHKN